MGSQSLVPPSWGQMTGCQTEPVLYSDMQQFFRVARSQEFQSNYGSNMWKQGKAAEH